MCVVELRRLILDLYAVKISKNEIDMVDIPQPFRTTQISEIVCMHGWSKTEYGTCNI